MIESGNPQGSALWLQDRLGIASASNFDQILTPAKFELSKSADRYMHRLLSERLTGEPHDTQDGGVETVWMARGKSLEAEAFAGYGLLTGCEPRTCGFCWLDERKRVGASPDALVGDDGVLEIKSPMLSTHIGYVLAGGLPDAYRLQVLGELYCTGRAWCDFVSYYPGMPLYVHRTWRDAAVMDKIAVALDAFCDALDAAEKRLIEMGYQRAT